MAEDKILSRVMKLQEDNIVDIRTILKELVYFKNTMIFVDLGCGDSQTTMKYLLDMPKPKIFVVDICNKIDKENRKELNLILSDLDLSIPLKDNSVDVIVCNQTIEHLKNLEKFFVDLKRVLKPGGFAVISTVNLSSLHSIIMLCLTIYPTMLTPFRVYLGNFLYGQPGVGHNWGFNRAILKDIAKYFGFELIKIWGEGYYFVPGMISRLFSKIFPYWAVYIGLVIRKPLGSIDE
jgi:ubiquinone/menaquinone biosynthesis C-methylase UbiE